jgi:hypothetical protein
MCITSVSTARKTAVRVSAGPPSRTTRVRWRLASYACARGSVSPTSPIASITGSVTSGSKPCGPWIQAVTGDTVRDLQLYLNPHAEHLLDWFHVAMRLTVLQQTAKGLPEQTRDEEQDYPLREPVVRELERLTWFLWHGNVYKALQVVQSVEMDLDAAVAMSGHGTARKLLKAVEESHTYIANNKGFIPNYGERYRAGERISTGFVESTVNQVISKRFCKKQQMAWTPCGAHLLLQIRTRVLNGDWQATFREWYPGLRAAPQPMAA